MSLQDFLYFFGYGLCHQLPERTLQSGDLFFAVCARDSGIQIGFACALIAAALRFAYLRFRKQATESDLPPAQALWVLAFFILPMAFDGLSSYLGFRPTTNELRYLTGMFAGVGAGTLVAPLLNGMAADSSNELKAFRRPLDLSIQIAIAFALTLLFYLVYPLLGVISPFIEVAGLLTLVTSLNLLLLSASVFKRPVEHLWQWLPWIGLALIATVLEIALFDALRAFIIQPLLGSAGIWSALPAI